MFFMHTHSTLPHVTLHFPALSLTRTAYVATYVVRNNKCTHSLPRLEADHHQALKAIRALDATFPQKNSKHSTTNTPHPCAGKKLLKHGIQCTI
mmetsp:Transcript_1014/g.2313  ORF Transcript_1014/g.2313 Transcript_1014/m.2313 type:complete len:94 (-) Transcript_1014:4801-5082(-)